MDLNYKKVKTFFIIITYLCLISCGEENYAPVQEANFLVRTPGYYQVKSGDTLYSVAWAFSKDYRQLAKRNHIEYPYAINPGQLILVDYNEKPVYASSYDSKVQTHQIFKRKYTEKSAHFIQPHPSKITKRPQIIIKREQALAVNRWNWPAEGKIINFFDPANNSKGIDIIGRAGSSIYATAGGEVVYSGSGLRGYGKLLIIKHNSKYLSAYAHNSILLVKEGQRVAAKQKIAEMGATEAQKVMLHFEIRKAGRPINPLTLLKVARNSN